MCPEIQKGDIIKQCHLLSTSYGPGTLLGTRDTMENKTDPIPASQRLLSSLGRRTINPRSMSDTRTNMQGIEIG